MQLKLILRDDNKINENQKRKKSAKNLISSRERQTKRANHLARNAGFECEIK